MRFLARIIANALGILLASLIIPGFVFTGSFKTLLFAGILLALANSIVRPILKLLSLPLIIITFGLFIVVINMVVLKIVDYFFISLVISLGALFWGTLLISVVGSLATALLKKKEG
ncbi:MAG: phage holin family protein [bacterium]|nr:phage holin family protein [bacterium]